LISALVQRPEKSFSLIMDLQSILYALGATGFFSSRAFIPAFFTSVFLRYGEYLPFLGDLPFVQGTGAEPTWFTSNLTILVLGALSLVEVGATKIPEARDLLDSFHRYAKTAVGTLATLGVLQTRDVEFIENTISMAGLFDAGIGAVVAGVIWTTAGLRNETMALFAEGDPDDDLGIQKLINWFEDIWASVGIFFFVLYPLAVVLLVGVFLGFLGLMRAFYAHREEKRKVPCPSCREMIYGSAPECPKCGTENPEPRQIGFFSQTTSKPVSEVRPHRLRLVTRRRCGHCATRLTERKLPQNCSGCGKEVLADATMRQRYLEMVSGRLPKVLGISFALSLIPAIGIIPGIIYYRLQLVAPFRAYLPMMRSFGLKWLLRLVFLLLISVQLVPGLGGIVVPIMALLSYSLYQRSFCTQLAES